MNVKGIWYILVFSLSFVGFIDSQISRMPIISTRVNTFLAENEFLVGSDDMNSHTRANTNHQESLECCFSDTNHHQEKVERANEQVEVQSDSWQKEKVLNDNPQPPIRYQRLWADYTSENLDYNNEEIFREQLKRFETSLTDMGHVELESRIAFKLKQLENGTVPGFEGIGQRKRKGSVLLTADSKTLSPRKREIRERILRRTKQLSLMEMHAEYIGLFEDRFSYWK